MSDHSSLRSELGLSDDQFYRRVRALADARIITPERGKKNQFILSDDAARVLRQFRAVEQNNPERPIEWCLERLRYEQADARVHELEGRAESLEDALRYSRTEAGQLRTALAVYKRNRNPFRRLAAWFRKITAPTEPSQS